MATANRQHERWIPEVDKQEIIDMHKEGRSMKSIAEITGRSRNGVRGVILKYEEQIAKEEAEAERAARASQPQGTTGLGVLGQQFPGIDMRTLVRTTGDLRNLEMTRKLQRENQEAAGELVAVTALSTMLAGLTTILDDAYGPSFWRWCEDRGIPYDEIRDYCLTQEEMYTDHVNNWIERVRSRTPQQQRPVPQPAGVPA